MSEDRLSEPLQAQELKEICVGPRFIRLTTGDGRKVAVDVNRITQVLEAINEPGRPLGMTQLFVEYGSQWIGIAEPYEDVMAAIEEAMR